MSGSKYHFDGDFGKHLFSSQSTNVETKNMNFSAMHILTCSGIQVMASSPSLWLFSLEVVKKLQELLHDLFFVIVFFLPYRFTGDCDYSNKYNRFSIANNILHDITAQLNYQ